jgi:phage terminase large subunit-like protein
MAKADPVEEGIDYAKRVAAGKIPAPGYTQLAAERFLNDLKLADAGRGPWKFNRARALQPIRISENLPNIKGPFAGEPIVLMPWQRCWTANLFGFVERETGLRRFRQASIWVPRGNGNRPGLRRWHSTVPFVRTKGGAEAYAAAVTRDQASALTQS